MKAPRFLMVFVAATAMMFAACNKPEDPEENTELAGTAWVGYQGNPQSDDSYAVYTLNFVSDNACTMSIAFYANSQGGNYATTHFEGTYAASGNSGTMTITDDILHEEYNDTFTLDGETLTLTHQRVTVTLSKSNGGDNGGDNGGGNENPPVNETAPNTFVLNGTVYGLNSYYSISQEGRGYVDAYAVDTLADGTAIFNIISDVSGIDTFDLTQSGSYYFRLSSNIDAIPGFDQSGEGGEMHGSIGETEYENEGSFVSGTLIIYKDDEVATLKVDGILKNVDTVSFYLHMPASEWEYLEW